MKMVWTVVECGTVRAVRGMLGGRSGVIYLIVLGLNRCRNCSCLGAELVEVAAEVGRHVQENFGKGDFVEPKVRKYVSSAWTTDRVTGSIQTNGI